MRRLLLLCLGTMLLAPLPAHARTRSYRDRFRRYRAEDFPCYHQGGGHYVGGVGRSHKGGHYVNPCNGNHYYHHS